MPVLHSLTSTFATIHICVCFLLAVCVACSPRDDTGSPQRPKRAPAAAATKRGQHQVLMHAILDEPAERLRHLLRLHQDALRAERELRISEAAVLLDANAHLKKLRRVEQLLALWHAAQAEARADASADGSAGADGGGEGEDDEEDADEAEFCRAVEAVMSATDEGGAFKKTHGAQQRSFQ